MENNNTVVKVTANTEKTEKKNKFTLPERFETHAPPYIRGYERSRTIMTDVLIALLPSFAWGVFAFGARALLIALVSIVSAFGFELLARLLFKRRIAISDLSSVVTGLIIAMCLPVNVPLWMVVLGSFFAVVIVKQLFGGIGKNIFNPAAAAVALLSLGEMAITKLANTADGAFADSAAQLPLEVMKNGALPRESIFDLLIGNSAGGMGEVSALFLIAGGVYLMFRRVITWHAPTAFIGTVMLTTLIFPRCVGSAVEVMLCELFSGALILAAVFMASDYATTPITPVGKLIFGVGCGIIAVLIRYFGASAEGAVYAVLIMNMLTPVIDKLTRPCPLGALEHRRHI